MWTTFFSASGSARIEDEPLALVAEAHGERDLLGNSFWFAAGEPMSGLCSIAGPNTAVQLMRYLSR